MFIGSTNSARPAPPENASPYVDEVIDGMLATASHHLGLDLAFVGSGEAPVSLGADNPADEPHGSAWMLPLRRSDGTRLGTLACSGDGSVLAPAARPALRLLARLLEDRIERSHEEAQAWRSRIASTGIQALLAALEARDGYTKEHSEAVVEMSACTAAELGLEGDALDEVKQVALLHDLGKIAVPEPILTKPGPLEPHEWHLVRRHPAIGARIVASVETLTHLAPAIRAGHERWDGRGYPDGLSGEGIPLASRIVSLSDAYDAMVSNRPYRPALPHGVAMRELAVGSGTQFCPTCVEALTSVA